MKFLYFTIFKKKVALAIYQKGYADAKKVMTLNMERLRTEMSNERRTHEIEIERLHGKYAEELYRVREQEKELWQNILEEKNFEISNLNRQAQEKVKTYEAIKNIAIELGKRTENVSDKFQRGIEKVVDGYKLIEAANGDIKHFNKIMQDRDPKVIKLLEGK